MLTIAQIKKLLKDKKKPDKKIIRWQEVYYGMSLHIDGAAPAFVRLPGDTSTLYNLGSGFIKPSNYYGPEYQRLFDNHLLNRHPRESILTRNWRYSVYRALTKAPFQKLVGVISGAIFQDSNYSIIINDKSDSDYIWGNNFGDKNIIQFFQWAVTSIFEDPNGYFVTIPKYSRYEIGTTVEPDIWFVYTKDILICDYEQIIFRKDGYVWAIDKTSIYKFKENGVNTGNYELTEKDGYYAHMLGYLPIDKAGGVWNNQGYFDSWLDRAKPIADEFIMTYSAGQLVDKEASHPYMIAAEEDCPKCDGGQIVIPCGCENGCNKCNNGTRIGVCDSCQGKGVISRNPGEWLIAPAEDLDKKLIQIINPDVSINKLHMEKVKALMESMLESLCLLKIDEAQSGVAKTIDRDELQQFSSQLSNDWFDRILHNQIRNIIAYRNVIAVEGSYRPYVYDFVIIKPTQFDIKTSMDLLAEFEAGTTANVPGFIRKRLMDSFVDKHFGGDDLMKKKSKVIGEIDPVCINTIEEKEGMVLGGFIDIPTAQFSTYLDTILDNVIRSKGIEWFMRADISEIQAAAQIEFKKIKPVPIPIITTNA